MGRVLHIVASCSGRKRLPVPEELRLRHFKGATVGERHSKWFDALNSSSTRSLRADELYTGDHAAVLRSAKQLAIDKGFDTSFWILSAGYGLVRESAELRSYSATFAAGDPDSVSSDASEKQEWWRLCCARRPRRAGKPVSIESLVAVDPDAYVLVVASERYLQAIDTDLREAIELDAKCRMRIISAAKPKLAGLYRARLVGVSAGAASALGGALASLHARVARDMIKTGYLDRPADKLSEKYSKRGAPRKDPGQSLSDEAVKRCIKVMRSTDPAISVTGALRKLRDQGLACEQRRFGRLFRESDQRRLFA